MQIQLRKVTPDYIEKEKRNASQIWEQDVSINKGEHLHIVAPSGSGKTSLMHFIYGLRKDYSGAVYYGNTDIKKLSVEDFSSFRKNKMSIIFQDLRLFEDQTVRENIEIKRILDPYYPAEKITEMTQRLGIENKLNQLARTCSYGEQQRIAIIRALMQPFDFLLLDEPYSHLDEMNRKKAMELIYEECQKRDAAMIFADLKPLDFLKGEKIVYL
ncbi:MAG TPA: ATP-binding cassette domain-containing protein [Hanamia sp.]|jgi:ABC-type lipoprotein export system ATPase subunit|nr:ATP-binding cassette domain-containing protein [Hanamia sp.]